MRSERKLTVVAFVMSMSLHVLPEPPPFSSSGSSEVTETIVLFELLTASVPSHASVTLATHCESETLRYW